MPSRLVLDAGPLIAVLHAADPEHARAVHGLRQLATGRVRLVAPVAIVFEVYKWLLREGGAGLARRGLTSMREGLEIAYPGPADLSDIASIVEAMSGWAGTLEDALVARTAYSLDASVWTLNVRDLAVFRRLRFWTPA